ncbi:predicted protein [Naegleria gruberi]|uniref:Predicted protein n=1 Tax=Naegleria gruberi TaxID=5762 RepID=D2VNM3_NAEGR|nr:uncharacterized protein NAEGRDRAFT_80658 [Naegleria gruberi]EFC41528.1 predicted protein [Naegleria gruberi]|eukprot:XP_002674272.1 predicted protein [Naegleria gruberi strain NEG-M]
MTTNSGSLQELKELSTSQVNLHSPAECSSPSDLATSPPISSPMQPPKKFASVKYDSSTTNSHIAEEGPAKSITTSIRTPRSSSVKSKDSDVILTCNTCLGTLQLSTLRIFSLSSLVINLTSFLILAGLIIAAFVLQYEYNNVWDNLDSDTNYYRETTIAAARSSVFSNYNLTLTQLYQTKYNTYLSKFSNNTAYFKALVPESIRNVALKGKPNAELETSKAIFLEQRAIRLAMNGNYSTAMILLNSQQYQTYLDGYKDEFQIMVSYVDNTKKDSQSVTVIMVTISLVVILISLILVVPVIVTSFVASVKKDESTNRKLNQVRAFLLMDTMEHPITRELFRKHCQIELSIENFQILEKISDYKILCERSFDIQEYLFELSSEISSDAGSDSTDHKKKKKKFSEKDLLDVEKKKYEISFEIYTDYLDVRGEKSVNLPKYMTDKVKNHLDLFATAQNEHLIDSLFDDVESEICILMLDTHHRFKQTIQFEKLAKKEAIKKRIII